MDLAEEIPLKDELSLLVFLIVLICIFLRTKELTRRAPNAKPRYTHVFPAQNGVTLDALYVTHNMVACGHLPFDGFTFKHVHPIGHQLGSKPGEVP